MYNSVYRTMITDNEARKFLDTFVGPSTSMASILRITRNATFALATRILLGLLLPLTRARTLFVFQTFTFTILKNTIFNEVYLHQRIWRHIFENGCGIMGLSTYYIMFRYKRAYLDPPPEKKEKTTPAPKEASTTKKPAFKRKDNVISYTPYESNYDQEQDYYNQQYNSQLSTYDQPLYGYVPQEEQNDAFYGYRDPVYLKEESNYSSNYYQPQEPNYADPSYTEDIPQLENKILTSFKSILAKLDSSGNKEQWDPVVTSPSV